MADLKFLCPQCGQRLSCDAQCSGQQIACPGCQSVLVVPAPSGSGPRLDRSAANSPRASQPNPSRTQRPFRRHKTNLLPTYAFAALIIGALLWAGYTLLPALTGQAPDGNTPKPAANVPPAATSAGPMGEVSGAMDVSDELDGNNTRRRAQQLPQLLLGTNSSPKR
jgi:hypothetical protein